MTAQIINYFKKRKDIWKCAICNKYVERKSRHVILEIHTIPPFLFVFHLFHYKEFLETLKNYFLNKDPTKLRKFVKSSIYDVREERTIANIMGFGEEFEADIKEAQNFIFYKVIKRTIKSLFSCNLTKEKITIKECFECKIEQFLMCNKGIFFSVRPETENFKIIFYNFYTLFIFIDIEMSFIRSPPFLAVI